MCGIVGATSRSQRRPDPDRGHSPARIPRLRLDRARRHQRRRDARCSSGSCRRRAWPISRRRPTRCSSRQSPAFRTRAGRRTARRRPTTRIRICPAAKSPSCTTASSRTTKRCATALKAQGYEFRTQTDTEVIAHLVHSHWHGDGERRPAARGAARRRRIPRRVRDRRDLDARAGPRDRRAPGQPAGRGHRRRRSLPRVRRVGAGAGHAARGVSRGRRRRRRAARVVRDLRRARASASSARSSKCRAAATPSSSDRIALHAEGNLRAAARGRRHARGRRRDRRRRCSAPRPRRSCRRSIRC